MRLWGNNTHLAMEQLSSQLSHYLWSLKKWEAHIETVVIPTPFTWFGCKYPQIKAVSLHLVCFISNPLWWCIEPKRWELCRCPNIYRPDCMFVLWHLSLARVHSFKKQNLGSALSLSVSQLYSKANKCGPPPQIFWLTPSNVTQHLSSQRFKIAGGRNNLWRNMFSLALWQVNFDWVFSQVYKITLFYFFCELSSLWFCVEVLH